MKEYLVKAIDNSCVYLGFRDKYPSEYDDVIEIPKGAELYVGYKNGDSFFSVKTMGKRSIRLIQ